MTSRSADYSCFLDESGDHGLTVIDKNFPLFLLCGVVIERDALATIKQRITAFKYKYFKTTHVGLHSRDLRKWQGVFQILSDEALRRRFYQDLNDIFEQGDYCIIGSAIHKERLIEKYGERAKDPYALSLTFILERLVFYLDQKDRNATVQVLAEQRGKKEDGVLLEEFNALIKRGSYVEAHRLQKRVKGISFHWKGENVIGLELADMFAYPLARHILRPKEPYIPFKVIERKIYCDGKGKYGGWGLKVFPEEK